MYPIFYGDNLKLFLFSSVRFPPECFHKEQGNLVVFTDHSLYVKMGGQQGSRKNLHPKVWPAVGARSGCKETKMESSTKFIPLQNGSKYFSGFV